MPQITANGLAIEYEEYGDPSAPPILLVMGLGAQLTLWPMEFVNALAERGFRVIRYDNRDVGLSQKMEAQGNPSIPWAFVKARLGLKPKSPYTLSDMAADGIGLLDALDIEAAHIVGASMGGMIAQVMAIEHPDRALSLTSIMSTTGHRKLKQADPAVLKTLTTRPKDMEMASIRAHGVAFYRAVGSPAYPETDAAIGDRTQANFERSFYPAGLQRQLAAIIADGDRRERLAKVRTPTLVVHGEADPLVPVDGGHDTARHIQGAALKLIPGMGHDLPLELVDEIAGAIADHAVAVRFGEIRNKGSRRDTRASKRAQGCCAEYRFRLPSCEPSALFAKPSAPMTQARTRNYFYADSFPPCTFAKARNSRASPVW